MIPDVDTCPGCREADSTPNSGLCHDCKARVRAAGEHHPACDCAECRWRSRALAALLGPDGCDACPDGDLCDVHFVGSPR